MKQIYAYPLRVYLIMGLLALVGILSGLKLPVSLFPNSAQPQVWLQAQYGSMTADEYRHRFGTDLESELRRIQTNAVSVERVDVTYAPSRADIDVTFRWGDDPTIAMREVDNVVTQFKARLGNARDYDISTWVNNWLS